MFKEGPNFFRQKRIHKAHQEWLKDQVSKRRIYREYVRREQRRQRFLIHKRNARNFKRALKRTLLAENMAEEYRLSMLQFCKPCAILPQNPPPRPSSEDSPAASFLDQSWSTKYAFEHDDEELIDLDQKRKLFSDQKYLFYSEPTFEGKSSIIHFKDEDTVDNIRHRIAERYPDLKLSDIRLAYEGKPLCRGASLLSEYNVANRSTLVLHAGGLQGGAPGKTQRPPEDNEKAANKQPPNKKNTAAQLRKIKAADLTREQLNTLVNITNERCDCKRYADTTSSSEALNGSSCLSRFFKFSTDKAGDLIQFCTSENDVHSETDGSYQNAFLNLYYRSLKNVEEYKILHDQWTAEEQSKQSHNLSELKGLLKEFPGIRNFKLEPEFEIRNLLTEQAGGKFEPCRFVWATVNGFTERMMSTASARIKQCGGRIPAQLVITDYDDDSDHNFTLKECQQLAKDTFPDTGKHCVGDSYSVLDDKYISYYHKYLTNYIFIVLMF